MALQNGGVAEDKSCCSPAVIVTFTGRSFKEFHRKYINNIKHLGEMSLIVAEMEYSRHLRAREFLTVA